MSTQNTAELIEIKKEILQIEKLLEKFITLLSKKQKIDFERTNDYGQRGFQLMFLFDEINIEAFNNIEEIKSLWRQFIELRRKQRSLETGFDIDMDIKKQMKKGMM